MNASECIYKKPYHYWKKKQSNSHTLIKKPFKNEYSRCNAINFSADSRNYGVVIRIIVLYKFITLLEQWQKRLLTIQSYETAINSDRHLEQTAFIDTACAPLEAHCGFRTRRGANRTKCLNKLRWRAAWESSVFALIRHSEIKIPSP